MLSLDEDILGDLGGFSSWEREVWPLLADLEGRWVALTSTVLLGDRDWSLAATGDGVLEWLPLGEEALGALYSTLLLGEGGACCLSASKAAS